MQLDEKTVAELESDVLRRLMRHLQGKPEVQNIDLMNLAGFCRNCLSNWLEDAARARGLALTRDAARQHVYGMPYEDWKDLHQKPTSVEQKAEFNKITKNNNH